MLAYVTRLSYWKSEHDEETCEDVHGEDIARGLFVVADGAGTTLFSQAWATFLVQHFLSVPLLSNEPFEVEWWMRVAQEQFKNAFPVQENMTWNAQQKMHDQGSYATLATIRVSECDSTHARVYLLAIGDSCILVNRPSTEHLLPFPLVQTSDFDRAPLCLPSKPGAFQRYFHQCAALSLDLSPHDDIMIATDAVAKWILSSGGGRYNDQKRAFQEVYAQTPDSWASFIQQCRRKREMIDDDCTAIVIHLRTDSRDNLDSADAVVAFEGGVPLGTTTQYSEQVRQKRKNDFAQALKDNNNERVAIYFGDGQAFKREGEMPPLEQIQHARAVADAQQEVLFTLRRVLNSPNALALITPAWQKHAQLLYDEACASNLRQTLVRLGVTLAPTVVLAPSIEFPEPDTTAEPAEPAPSQNDATSIPSVPISSEVEPDMLETKPFIVDVQDVLHRAQVEQGEA